MDASAPFGSLLPPPHLALTRRKPPTVLQQPSKNYPEVSSPPWACASPPRARAPARAPAQPWRLPTARARRAQVSGPSKTLIARAAAPLKVQLVRRTRTLHAVSEESLRSERLSGELIGKSGRFVGHLRGGIPHGKGQLWVPVGPGKPQRLAYEGDWEMGMQTGFGTLYFPCAEEYSGEVKGGQMHGRGRYTHRNGDSFQGTWVDGRRCGEGRLKFANGDVFVGTFEGAARRGYGVYYYVAKGSRLEGEWLGDRALCGTMRAMTAEEAASLLSTEWRPTAATPPALWLAQPARALFGATAGLRPAEGGGQRELSQDQMERLRHAFTALARGDGPGVGLELVELPRVLQLSGVLDTLAEEDRESLAAALQAAAQGGRLDVDAFLGAVFTFRCDAPRPAAAPLLAMGQAPAAKADGMPIMRQLGGSVHARSPVRMAQLAATMKKVSMAGTGAI